MIVCCHLQPGLYLESNRAAIKSILKVTYAFRYICVHAKVYACTERYIYLFMQREREKDIQDLSNSIQADYGLR